MSLNFCHSFSSHSFIFHNKARSLIASFYQDGRINENWHLLWLFCFLDEWGISSYGKITRSVYVYDQKKSWVHFQFQIQHWKFFILAFETKKLVRYKRRQRDSLCMWDPRFARRAEAEGIVKKKYVRLSK